MIKTFFKIIAWILVLVILTVGGYAAYLLLDYERIENNVEISVRHGDAIKPEAGMEYKLISYNIGFAAYTSDFGFFMDGGSESRAFSKQSVLDTMSGIISVLKEEDADFMMIEEVDEDATRSYYVNERSLLESAFSDGAAAFAVNYDSSYFFYPFSA
ncbi:MAG: hypothetical protein GX633_06840, partial [Clostridiales bacterium]|nr:hypothetical protein [Clostridiales bacterium]